MLRVFVSSVVTILVPISVFAAEGASPSGPGSGSPWTA